jgi:hypothetical protein
MSLLWVQEIRADNQAEAEFGVSYDATTRRIETALASCPQ